MDPLVIGLAVKPPWFLDNSPSLSTARALTLLAADMKPTRLPGIIISAVRGCWRGTP